VHEVLRTPGQPLDRVTRAGAEARFGYDFSRVRVHTDARAAQSARAVNALAYTVGPDVVFGAGHYAPMTTTGSRLLAHELTHVVQQGDGGGAGALDATRPGDAAEREADAVSRGERVAVGAGGGVRLARQDAGPDDAGDGGAGDGGGGAAPDGGRDAGPDAGTGPDAGGGAPPDPAGPGPTPPPVRVLRVEVHPDHRGHFPRIPGTGAGSHWVGVASDSARKPIVQAVVDPAVPPTDPAVAGIVWSGADVTPDPSNPLQVEVDRLAGRRHITATLNGASASTTVWAVFARIRTTAGPAPASSSNAARARPGGTADFDATIHPASILTAADRPALDGANDTPAPGGTHVPSGATLGGGANHHWDFSRKSRVRLINPAAIPVANMVVPGDTAAANIFAAAPWGYPATWEEGNDDASPNDENNDPYAGPMTSTDRPGVQLSHAGGADGDTFEIRVHFLEFVRLELARSWWVISHMFPWRVHMRVRKDAGRWVDNATEAEPDNAGF
jgi:hypothetical protein